MGSPEIAVPTLEAVAGAHTVVAVVTQPDRPRGRGQDVAAPAVKLAAQRLGLPVLQPTKIRTPEFEAELRALDPDVGVVIAYGRILPANILAVPRHGCLNVHASLLPRYRGAAPIQWSIIRGERETGVTLMRMDVGLDTGPMLLERSVAITDDDTTATLTAKLAPLGAEVTLDGLARLAAGTLTETPQDHAQHTLAPMLDKSSGKVDFTQPARAVSCLVRGVEPWPGATCLLGGEVLKLFGPRVLSGTAPPGTVLGADRDGLVVACGEGAVAFAELQLPGRKRMSARALLVGRPIPPGTVLT